LAYTTGTEYDFDLLNMDQKGEAATLMRILELGNAALDARAPIWFISAHRSLIASPIWPFNGVRSRVAPDMTA
jgi:hypothetical protein